MGRGSAVALSGTSGSLSMVNVTPQFTCASISSLTVPWDIPFWHKPWSCATCLVVIFIAESSAKQRVEPPAEKGPWLRPWPHPHLHLAQPPTHPPTATAGCPIWASVFRFRLPYSHTLHIQGAFFTGPPPEKLKYGKLRLGEVRCI